MCLKIKLSAYYELMNKLKSNPSFKSYRSYTSDSLSQFRNHQMDSGVYIEVYLTIDRSGLPHGAPGAKRQQVFHLGKLFDHFGCFGESSSLEKS